jgi:hypothetical protein
MVDGQLLFAPENLIDRAPVLLNEHGIDWRVDPVILDPDSCLYPQGLICDRNGVEVAIGYSREEVDPLDGGGGENLLIILQPLTLKWFFLPNPECVTLMNEILELLLTNGASTSFPEDS